jgi:putative glutamine amidotransferase
MMKIGLTYTGMDWKHDNYVRWLSDGVESVEVARLEAGGTSKGMKDLDALVLSGGIDIYPSLYGGSMEYAENNGWKKERDDFELKMLEEALGKGVPVLGVCRGLQLINVYRKGTLVQDLGMAGDKIHMAEGGDKQHAVRIERDTVLAAVAGQSGGVVNSAHHQAVERLGEGLRVNCVAADGTIEGLEWAEPEGRPFMLAVQWHPERMYVNGLADTALYRAIRDRFMEEVGKAMAAIRPGDKKNNQ